MDKSSPNDLEDSPFITENRVFTFTQDEHENYSERRYHLRQRLGSSNAYNINKYNQPGEAHTDISSYGNDEHHLVNAATAVSRNWKVVYFANCMQSVISVSLYLTIFLTVNGTLQEIFDVPKELRSLRSEIASKNYKV